MSLVILQEVGQNGYTIGESRVKRSAADLLVSQKCADKIGRHLYRRRIVRVRIHAQPVPGSSICNLRTLPPRELPGLRYQQSAIALEMQAGSQVIGFRRLRRAEA